MEQESAKAESGPLTRATEGLSFSSMHYKSKHPLFSPAVLTPRMDGLGLKIYLRSFCSSGICRCVDARAEPRRAVQEPWPRMLTSKKGIYSPSASSLPVPWPQDSL